MSVIKKQILLSLVFIAFLCGTSTVFSQNTNRDGFIFEFGVGVGVISVEDSEGDLTFDESKGTFSFPEFKFGYMLNDRLAIAISLPGQIYEFKENDRHFGGIIPSLQYWANDKWWIQGGFGLGIDGPALYDIEDDVNDDWNFGKAVMLSTGYEFLKRKNFAMNLQSKVVLGQANLSGDAHRNAVIFNIGVGFNWF